MPKSPEKAKKTEETNENAKAKEVKTVEVATLEEEDNFEEFVADEVDDKVVKEDEPLWEEDWDDDLVEEDFSRALGTEMQKRKQHFTSPPLMGDKL